MRDRLLFAVIGFCMMCNVGCASVAPVPKETVRTIFTEVKNRNYEIAQRTFAQSPNSTGFEIYEGDGATFGTIKAEDLRQLLGVATSFVRTCEELVKQVKELSNKNSVQNSEEDGSGESSPSLEDVKSEFQSECELAETKEYKGYRRDELNTIKRYSTVDLLAEVPRFKKAFYLEVSRIESQIAKQHQDAEKAIQDEAAKKEAYENSSAFYSKKLCEMQTIINAAKSVIAKEKEAAEVSGYVDKNRMYQAGQAVTINSNRIKHFSSEYKSKFGKDWSSSECK